MGFETGNCHVEGILKEIENNTVEILSAMGTKEVDLEINLI